MALPIRIGEESFPDIREKNSLYVDKTSFLLELLSPSQSKVSLITRPRRFGKSLTLSMVETFLDIRRESGALFAGLKVSENKDFCSVWMNKYPVLSVSFKGVESKEYVQARNEILEIIIGLFSSHSYLRGNKKVGFAEQRAIEAILSGTDDDAILKRSLYYLVCALHSYYGKKVVLLIDEYDVPYANAEDKEHCAKTGSLMRSLLGAALKGNTSLEFAILTGCMRLAKESCFTGLNSLDCFGIADVGFADCFGFTESEVRELLEELTLPQKMDDIRAWYDGYHFGNDTEIYCPWDVLQYLKALAQNPTQKPKRYWENTSSNDIVRIFLSKSTFSVREKFEKLLDGGCIGVRINENLTYDSLYDSEENLWTVLYLTGYLTKASNLQKEKCGYIDNDEYTCLIIPNREIRDIYTYSIRSWFKDTIKERKRDALFRAMWAADEKEVTRQLASILLDTISYYDYHENFYHGFTLGTFSGEEFPVKSNQESGYGRPDIIVRDPENARTAIIELKQVDAQKRMEKAAREALRQSMDKDYGAPFRRAGETVLHWGIAFCGKACLARAAVDQT